MILHKTLCIDPTCAFARISAFFIYTSLVARTVGMYDTFWFTKRRRTRIRRQTWTWCQAVVIATICVESARRWNTRVCWRRCYCWYLCKCNRTMKKMHLLLIWHFEWQQWIAKLTQYLCACGKWISRISLKTGTNGAMVYYFTFSIPAARLRTGIYTSVIDTSLVWFAFCIYNTFWSAIWWRSNVII